jgi:hypothetical protein
MKDTAFVKVLGGNLNVDEFFRFYTKVELNRMKQSKGNETEYGDFSSEQVAPELRQIVVWDDEAPKLMSNNGRSAYCSQSPTMRSKENAYRAINNITAKTAREVLHVEISKSSEGYVVRNKQELDCSPKFNSHPHNSKINPMSTTNASILERRKCNGSNNENLQHSTSGNYGGLQLPAPANNNVIPNLFGGVETDTMRGSSKRLSSTLTSGTSNGKLSNSVDKTAANTSGRFNMRKY